MTLLKMSFSGTVFILAVAIIRAIALNNLPKKTFLVLWETALFRLMIPFTVPSAFSIYKLMNHRIFKPSFIAAET
ncbi:MAG: peptidase M56, partial [Lachnospiraceae bacterium]|nr:peptidase M56 [Lachnospiraceae bacterium]